MEVLLETTSLCCDRNLYVMKMFWKNNNINRTETRIWNWFKKEQEKKKGDQLKSEEKREKALQRFAFVHEADRTAGVATSNEVKSFSDERPT